MSYLLDTNIVSESRKRTVNPGVQRWLASVREEPTFVSVLVIGEILRGIERLKERDPRQANGLERWLEMLRATFDTRILPVTLEIAETWGRLNDGRPLPVIDGLQAATAIVHGLTIVTRNTADFERTGAPVINPFTS